MTLKICPACGNKCSTLVRHAIESHNGLEGLAKELNVSVNDLWKIKRNKRLYKREFGDANKPGRQSSNE